MRLSAFGQRRGRAALWLLVGLLIGGAVGAGTVYVLKRGKAGLPGGPRLGNAEELAMVPTDAVGFVHIRARDLWRGEDLADLRKVIDKAGPDALKALDEGFVPAPSSLDRVTLVVLANPNATNKPTPPRPKFPGQPPLPEPTGPLIQPPSDVLAVGILTFTEAYDAGKVRSAYIPAAAAKTANGKEYWVDEAKGIGAYFPSEKVMVIGMSLGVAEFVKKQSADGKQPAGPLSRSLAQAAEGGRHVFGAVNARLFQINPAALGDELRNAPMEFIQLAKDLQPILKAEAFAFAVSISGDDSRVDVRAYYKDDKEAAEAEAGIRAAAAFGRTKLGELKKEMERALNVKPRPRPIEQLPGALLAYAGLGGINSIDELLANPPLKRDGSEVVLSADKPTITNVVFSGYATVLGALFPAVEKVREAAGRMQGSNNLKQIGLAMHNYHDSIGTFPAPDGKQNPNAKGGGLSWRVHILPYIDEDNLYRRFKLDEPWDSESNKKLIPLVPKVYVSPLAPADEGRTYYKVFVGNGAAFEAGRKLGIPEFADGTSNTILAVEGGEPVIWTKPDDIAFNANFDPMSIVLNGNPRISVLLGDGSVRNIDLSRMSALTLKAAITRAGGEVLGPDWNGGLGGAGQFEFVPQKNEAPAPKGKGAAPKPPGPIH